MTAFPSNRPPPYEGQSTRTNTIDILREVDRDDDRYPNATQHEREQTTPAAPASRTLTSRSRTLSLSSISSYRSTDVAGNENDIQARNEPPAYTDNLVREPIERSGTADPASLSCPGYVEETVATDDGTIERVALPCDHANPRCEESRNDLAARAFENTAAAAEHIPVYEDPFDDRYTDNEEHTGNGGAGYQSGPPPGSWTFVDGPTNMAYFWNSQTSNLVSVAVSAVGDVGLLWTLVSHDPNPPEGIVITAMTQTEAQRFREDMQRTTERIQRDVERGQRDAERAAERAQRDAERTQRDTLERAQRAMERQLRIAEHQMRDAQRRTEHQLRQAMGEVERGMQNHAAQLRRACSQQHWPRWNNWGRTS